MMMMDGHDNGTHASMPMMMPPMAAMDAHNHSMMPPHQMMMMHMTFYWGKSAEILFSGWPGPHNAGMYAASLVVVFLLAAAVEFLSHCRLLGSRRSAVVGFVRTGMHVIRMGLAYMVMLAVMSFNVGVLLSAIAGHGFGFLLFGSGLFRKGEPEPRDSYQKNSDLPPMSC